MAYVTKYNFQFSNQLDELYYLRFKFDGYIGTPQSINVSVNGFILRSVTGDEDKLTPILGLECIISILVGRTINKGIEIDDSTLTVFDLIAAHDNDIQVEIVKVQPNYEQPVFLGFVVVEDNTQPYQDPPFVLQIRALDGLGQLKNADMIDADGDLFAGNLSIEDWLGNILMKTGLVMNLRTYFPFNPLTVTGNNPLQVVYLNAITWQTGELTTTTDPSVDLFAEEADNAYTALEKICRCFRCRLFQHDGVWNFVSLYTYVDPNGWSYVESESVLTDGVYHQNQVAVSNNLDLTIPVGKEDIIHPVENDAVVSLKLATKWIKLSYTYDQSLNKVCNQNFKLGNANPTFDGTISSTVEDPTLLPAVTFTTLAYSNFCWPGFSGTPIGGGTSPFPETAQTADIYIREVQDLYNAQENRYLVITNAAANNHVKSSTFLVDVNDVIQFSFDYRTYSDISPGNIIAAHLLLDGDDGSHWGLGSAGITVDNQWFLLDANYRIGGGADYPPLIEHDYGASESTMSWYHYEVDKTAAGFINRVPVSGRAFILLVGGPIGGGTENWFKNLQVTILAYMQGSYRQLKGDYNYSSSDLTIKQTLKQDVEISDSPKRYYKGALVQSNGDLVAPIWHRKGVLEAQRFQQLMERVVYNNLYRQFQKIEGTFRGHTYTLPDFTVKPSGYLNAYTFTQHPVPTKRFILTSFERNYGTGRGRHVFVEILEDENADPFVNPATPPGTYLFQYIYQ